MDVLRTRSFTKIVSIFRSEHKIMVIKLFKYLPQFSLNSMFTKSIKNL